MSFQDRVSGPSLTVATLVFSALTFASQSHAAGDPRGVWYDHNGRGAVEIKECSGNTNRLCGHVVYVKKARNKKRCGMQIIGNVRKNGRGWIYSPSRGRSYPLAVKKLSENRLRIIGNAGSFFTKKYIWKRAPDGIANCNQPTIAKKKPAAQAQPTKTVAKQPAQVETSKPESKSTPQTATNEPTRKANTTSSATAALIANTRIEDPVEVAPEPTDTADADNGNVDDLSPPGGLSNGGSDKLAKLDSVIKKFTGGKGLKGMKLNGKGRGKCKFRIPYVGRTINVPCK